MCHWTLEFAQDHLPLPSTQQKGKERLNFQSLLPAYSARLFKFDQNTCFNQLFNAE